jgi:hypothetical protein
VGDRTGVYDGLYGACTLHEHWLNITPGPYSGESHKGCFWLGRVLSRRKSNVRSNDGWHPGFERKWLGGVTYLEFEHLNFSMASV